MSYVDPFQSTRPRGRTRPVIFPLASVPICFNPRVLAGGRDSARTRFCFCNRVSIHASSREDATSMAITAAAGAGFNPRVLTGGRDSRRIVRTEPQRGFNPRVLTGGRDFYAQLSFELQVFQSTRPHGRTRLAFILSWYILPVSIHGPHGRTRLPIHCIRHCCHVSIHASSREDAT